jgi:hypothetical protein
MISFLPSWVGTGATFKNRETGEMTFYDLRRRAFPQQAYRQPSFIRSREYLDAYNANPAACTTFWGHSGRQTMSEARYRPIIHRIGFICIALFFVFKGFWNTLWYKLPNLSEEILKHIKTITYEDVARMYRLLGLWQGLVFSGLLFVLCALFFGLAGMGSMVVLFFQAFWKYIPEEERETLARNERDRVARSGREGVIRLE